MKKEYFEKKPLEKQRRIRRTTLKYVLQKKKDYEGKQNLLNYLRITVSSGEL
jgi:hypothetical protein